MPVRPARLPVGSIGHGGRGRARARTGQRAVGHTISESAPGPARPPTHRRWGPCRWERHWVDSLERAGRGTRRAGGPGPHRRPMAGPSTRTSSTTGSPRSSWQAPGTNLRAIFCVSPHSSPFNRARKSPHKTWNSPAFPANQTSVFAHHVLILLQPAHGAHVFQSHSLITLGHMGLTFHLPQLHEFRTAPLPCTDVFLRGPSSAVRGSDLLPRSCPRGLVWRFSQRVCLVDFRLAYSGLFLAEQLAVRSRPRRQGDLLPQTCLRRDIWRFGRR